MKKIALILLLALPIIAGAQNPSQCNCTYPLKNNTNWCVGPKGGNYCINNNGNKTYKSSVKQHEAAKPTQTAKSI